MDLALELRMTAGELGRRMTFDELMDWKQYVEKRLLPSRRIELYLAQVAQTQAGGALSDYLMRPNLAVPETEATDAPSVTEIEIAAESLVDMAGGGIVVVRRKPKAPAQPVMH